MTTKKIEMRPAVLEDAQRAAQGPRRKTASEEVIIKLPIARWNELRDLAFSESKARGFHDHINQLLALGVDLDEVRRLGAAQRVALLTEELGEVVTELRAAEPRQSRKIPDYTALEEEMADVIIRCFELAAFLELDIEGAAKAKLLYNRSRPHKHGGKKF